MPEHRRDLDAHEIRECPLALGRGQRSQPLLQRRTAVGLRGGRPARGGREEAAEEDVRAVALLAQCSEVQPGGREDRFAGGRGRVEQVHRVGG
uniref:hypothetical protein n=1 Tax=Streptomyces violaceoruber TaxID=1935 RepID=UPI000AC2F1AB